MSLKDEIEFLKKCDLYYYSTGTPLIPDSEYDERRDLLDPNDPLASEYLRGVGAEGDIRWVKATHKIPMGSLTKSKSIEEFKTWYANHSGKEIVVQPKCDGLSIGVYYKDGKIVDAITRGDGVTGESILRNVRKMKGFKENLPDNFSGGVRAEIVILKPDFKKLLEVVDEKPANARNAASGISRRFDGSYTEYCSLIHFGIESDSNSSEVENHELLTKYFTSEYSVPNSVLKEDVIQGLENIYIDYIDSVRESTLYDIDGLVIKCNDLQYQEDLGEVGGRPRAQHALKFPPVQVKTIFKGVIWNTSRTGRVNPIADLEPVQLDGSTVKRASLHSIPQMEDLGLTEGCEVIIEKAGDIIPQIVKRWKDTGGPNLVRPTNCPVCGSKLYYDETFIWCRNKHECKVQVIERLVNYVQVMEMDRISESLITTLYESNLMLRNPFELYHYIEEDFVGLPRVGEATIKNFISERDRTKKCPLERFLKALGIINLSSFAAGALVAKYKTIDAILNAREHELEEIEGIGGIVANDIYKGLIEYKDDIEAIIPYLELEKRTSELEGITFCITGKLEKAGRKEYEKKISAKGGKVASSVTAKVQYLVTNDPNSGSSKNKKAVELNVPIISEDDLTKMIEGE